MAIERLRERGAAARFISRRASLHVDRNCVVTLCFSAVLVSYVGGAVCGWARAAPRACGRATALHTQRRPRRSGVCVCILRYGVIPAHAHLRTHVSECVRRDLARFGSKLPMPRREFPATSGGPNHLTATPVKAAPALLALQSRDIGREKWTNCEKKTLFRSACFRGYVSCRVFPPY
jgi:hypothetical protein